MKVVHMYTWDFHIICYTVYVSSNIRRGIKRAEVLCLFEGGIYKSRYIS